jgi:PEP-CTERM motif
MRKVLRWTLIATAALIPFGANAATYSFDFSTTDSVFTVTGTITTADAVDAIGGYDVLSISGTISGPSGGTIALVPNPSQPYPEYGALYLYDNVYFPAGPTHVDANGILFSAGGYDYNLYSYGTTTQLSSNNPASIFLPGQTVSFGDPGRADFAAGAPEPSTWALMLLGFTGLAVAGWRKARAGAASSVTRHRKAHTA